MNTQKSSGSSRAEQPFRVGSQVIFQFGRERMKGVITEDRGAIGVGGRRLFRVEAPFGPDEPPLITEMPADDLQSA